MYLYDVFYALFYVCLDADGLAVDGGISLSKRELIQKKEDTNQTDSISRSGETVYDLLFKCVHD